MVKRSFHLDEDLDRALSEFCQKTGERPSMVIRKALEEFIINKAEKVIPRLSAQVMLNKRYKEFKKASQLMKLLYSSGFGAWNLREALEKIDRMPLTEAEKEKLRETAEHYNKFKKNGSSEIVKLLKTAFPTLSDIVEQKKRRPTLLEFLWKNRCKGCSNIGNEEFCKNFCKMYRRLTKPKQRSR